MTPRPKPKPSRLTLCVGFLVLGLVGAASTVLAQDTPSQDATAQTAPAQDSTTDADSARKELQALQSSIIISRERAEALKAEIAEMDGDRSQQTATLIAAAQRVKLAEIEVNAIETRLLELIETETNIRNGLDGADRNTANLLAALQRISISPPPALLVNPSDAVSAARGAGLLASVLPQVEQKALIIGEKLQTLVALRKTVEAEKDVLRAKFTALSEEQLRTATLIEARKRGVSRINANIAEEEDLRKTMAARAEDLGTLINNLKTGAATGTTSDKPDPAWTNLDAAAIKTALAKTERREPATPFAAIRGYLTLPATGVVVTPFGTDDGLGGIAQGVSLVTRADAQVVAPADGWVLYKGPYLNYGQIVILNPGQGYSILLAGLKDTSVELGQFVVMGEPLGTMGSRASGLAVTTGTGASRPTLYIELREQDTPLNPDNWWADQTNQTQTG